MPRSFLNKRKAICASIVALTAPTLLYLEGGQTTSTSVRSKDRTAPHRPPQGRRCSSYLPESPLTTEAQGRQIQGASPPFAHSSD